MADEAAAAEVNNFHQCLAALHEQHVFWFNVAVDDTVSVTHFKAVKHLLCEHSDVAHW